MTWHDTQHQDLIRVGAKLCRTVALQDPSFPGPHYDTNLSLYQMQYINAFQVFFFSFSLIDFFTFLTDLGTFCIAPWTLSYDMWMENFLPDCTPLLHNVALRQCKNILMGRGVRGGQIKCFINKMFPNKSKITWNNLLSCTIKINAVEGYFVLR